MREKCIKRKEQRSKRTAIEISNGLEAAGDEAELIGVQGTDSQKKEDGGGLDPASYYSKSQWLYQARQRDGGRGRVPPSGSSSPCSS